METNSLDIGMIGNGVDDNTDVTNMNQDDQILLQMANEVMILMTFDDTPVSGWTCFKTL